MIAINCLIPWKYIYFHLYMYYNLYVLNLYARIEMASMGQNITEIWEQGKSWLGKERNEFLFLIEGTMSWSLEETCSIWGTNGISEGLECWDNKWLKRKTVHSKEGIKLCRTLKSYINVFVFILIIMRNNLRHFHFMVDIGDSCMKLLISFLPGWQMD